MRRCDVMMKMITTMMMMGMGVGMRMKMIMMRKRNLIMKKESSIFGGDHNDYTYMFVVMIVIIQFLAM